MSAASADRNAGKKDGVIVSYKVDTNTQIYKDTLVSLVAGYLQPADDTSGDLFAGVAMENVDNNPGAAGALNCRVWKQGVFTFVYGGTATQADVGKAVYAVDDQTVDLVGVTTNDILVGYITEVLTATSVRVRINRAVQ